MTGPERRLGVKSENSGINHAGAFIREQDTAGKKAAKMIQDIAPHKLNNQYGQKKAPDAGSRFLYYDGRKVLVRKGIGGNENQIAYRCV